MTSFLAYFIVCLISNAINKQTVRRENKRNERQKNDGKTRY